MRVSSMVEDRSSLRQAGGGTLWMPYWEIALGEEDVE
jgi:hypothetical protein